MHLHICPMCPLRFNGALSRFIRILWVSSSKWPHAGDKKYIYFMKHSATLHWFVWSFNLNLKWTPPLLPHILGQVIFFLCLNAFLEMWLCACVRLVPSHCHHVCEGKVRGGKATCCPGTWMRWEVVSKVIGLFVYVFYSTWKHDGISTITATNY